MLFQKVCSQFKDLVANDCFVVFGAEVLVFFTVVLVPIELCVCIGHLKDGIAGVLLVGQNCLYGAVRPPFFVGI